jgi:hypothetical protein
MFHSKSVLNSVCVEWIYLAQDSVQLRALVSTVMNISGP